MDEPQTDFPILEDILPPQHSPVHDERLDITFANRVQVSLLIDALPGCGGVVWPAGEVTAFPTIFLSRYN